MFNSIRAALGLWSDISQEIEYWEEFKGKRIHIRSHSVERKTDTGSSFNQTSFIISGEVDDVRSYPPGFLLKDVEEVVHMSDFELLFGAGTTKSVDVQGTAQSKEVLRRIDEKFVSFDSIEEIERASNVESAEEPYREETL